MENDLLNWAESRARKADPETSRAAARATAGRSLARRRMVFECLRLYGPMTDEELAEHFPAWGASTARTRRSELQEQGLVIPTGNKRPTRTGTMSIVWAALPLPPGRQIT